MTDTTETATLIDQLWNTPLITAIAGAVLTVFLIRALKKALSRDPKVEVQVVTYEKANPTGKNPSLDPEEVETRRHSLFMALTIATAATFGITMICLTIQYAVSVSAKNTARIDGFEATVQEGFDELDKAIQELRLSVRSGDKPSNLVEQGNDQISGSPGPNEIPEASQTESEKRAGPEVETDSE